MPAFSMLRRVTLGAGTDFASGQVECVEVNMKHPLMSGLVISVERLAQAPEPLSGAGSRAPSSPSAPAAWASPSTPA